MPPTSLARIHLAAPPPVEQNDLVGSGETEHAVLPVASTRWRGDVFFIAIEFAATPRGRAFGAILQAACASLVTPAVREGD